MKRDAELTRRRILAAATAEFSTHGFAGARIDRIAAAAEANKQLIYAYYGNKEGLFEAVFDAVVIQTMDAVPIDADDLPGWAVRLFDEHSRHPEALRISYWDRLERGGTGNRAKSLRAARREKVDAIEAAQLAGTVADHFAPDVLLDLILAISQVGTPAVPAIGRRSAAKQRAAIASAVADLSGATLRSGSRTAVAA
jgi:AcrR family transcriptional regulator